MQIKTEGSFAFAKPQLIWSPTNINGARTTLHNLLFCVHRLCMNYVTNTFLLVSSSIRSKQQLCFVHGQGQKSDQNIQTRTLSSSPVPLLDLYFDLFSYLVAPIVSSTGGIVWFIYLLFAELITNSVWKATGFLTLSGFITSPLYNWVNCG